MLQASIGQNYFAGAAGVVEGGAAAGVEGAAGAAGFVVAAGGGGACVPLTTEEAPPRWPMMDNESAISMNSTAATVVALVSSVAPERAPNAA